MKPLDEIAGGDLGWLKARHHFAIGLHGNPAHKAIGNLYVLNDDEVAPGKGFGAHRHADVEIVTYVGLAVLLIGTVSETKAALKLEMYR